MQVKQNVLAKLVPLNAMLAEDVKLIAQHTRVETLPAGKVLDLNGMPQRFYVLKGRVELLRDREIKDTVEGGTSSARYALNKSAHQGMRVRTATPIEFIRVDMNLVEGGSPQKLQEISQLVRSTQKRRPAPYANKSEIKKPQKNLWLDRLMESPIFRQLSPSSIRRIVERLDDFPQNKGDVIIHQGEKGTSFFVVKKGRCQVVRKSGGQLQKLTVLEIGDTFGSLGLMADVPHEVSVVMSEPGEILRLDKDDFFSWVVDPVVKSMGFRQATQLHQEKGAHWLDVRSLAEHRSTYIEHSLHIPLVNLHIPFDQLRRKVSNLPEKGPFLVYSNQEQRASAGAYRLLEQGLEAYVLRGGISEAPRQGLKRHQSKEARERQEAAAQQKARREQEAKARARAEELARREAEKKASAEAEALLAQVREEARRLEEERQRQAKEKERQRQKQNKQKEAEKQRLEEEKIRESQALKEKYRQELEEQLEAIRSNAELEREEQLRLEEQLMDELRRMSQEKEEFERYREELEADRQRAEEESKLLQIQLKAARAVDERRKEMEQILAKETPPPPRKSMYVTIGVVGLLLSLGLVIFLDPGHINHKLIALLPSPSDGVAAPSADSGENGEPGGEAAEQTTEQAESVTPEPIQLVEALKVYQDRLRGGGSGPEMLVLPGGDFLMGSDPELPHPGEHPQHKVTLNNFSISRYEITFDEYDHFARRTNRSRPDDSGWGRGRQPVINVSWEDAKAYTQWLSSQTGHQYRLPSEREWEYAVRAGTRDAFWWGDEMQPGAANCADCGTRWSGRQPAPVGQFGPNPAGLFEVAANVSEWVEECEHQNYRGAPRYGHVWEGGNCTRHMVRGGSFETYSSRLRLTQRRGYPTRARSNSLGFRVVRVD